jgi:hypothetical protein
MVLYAKKIAWFLIEIKCCVTVICGETVARDSTIDNKKLYLESDALMVLIFILLTVFYVVIDLIAKITIVSNDI